jgi:polyphosphate kinase
MGKTENTYLNRELSWIEFNARVLDEARQRDVPLLERLRFLTIVSSNFDEFFMVRVASLKARFRANPDWRDIDGLTARETLDRISSRVHEIISDEYAILIGDIFPRMAAEGIHYITPSAYTPSQTGFLDSYFMTEVLPLLTPLRANNDGCLPSIGNLRLHTAFLLKSNVTVPVGPLADYLVTTGALPSAVTGTSGAATEVEATSVAATSVADPLAFVQVPASLPRIVRLPGEEGHYCFALLDDVIRFFGQRIFPGFTVQESLSFKVARDADFAVDEEREDDYIAAMQEVLVSRMHSLPVRLICNGNSPTIKSFLRDSMGFSDADLYHVGGPIDLPTLVSLANIDGFDRLRNPEWKNFWPVGLPADVPLWDELKRTDVLLHVPYVSYDPVLRFINDAADDPSVLAIKMTLYRTSGDSPIVRALERAAIAGKHVTVFVEIKARFDEARNIAWARRLEEVGVIVVYGIAGLKVHAKALLVIRKEPDGIHRYVHLSTGNYNDRTARFYVDMSLMTTNRQIADDATIFFNMISGYSAIIGTKRLVMAPIDLKSRLVSLIEREIERSVPEKRGRIVAKMNSLADPQIIEALYRASRAGVHVDLNVRGLCMLVPGVAGMSENITVVSVIDRYLEHTRIAWFENGGADELYLSSADWMPRNLDRRVELMFPVLQESIRNTIRDVLMLYFADNRKSHYLMGNGSWKRRRPVDGEAPVRAQETLYEAEKRRRELFEREPQREFTVRRN